MRHASNLLFALALLATGCATTGAGIRGASRTEFGTASYYSSEYNGQRTASGRRYDECRLTAAHRSYPFGAQVRVTNLENHRHVVVTITDRGPYGRGRVIDVSRRAARDLGFLAEGTARVRVDLLEP